jgi:hypothetical protein
LGTRIVAIIWSASSAGLSPKESAKDMGAIVLSAMTREPAKQKTPLKIGYYL